MKEHIARSEQLIPLEPRARLLADRTSLLTHVFVAASLLQEAIPAIRTDPSGAWFGWVEFAAAAALIVAAAREMFQKKKEGDHPTVAWTEIAAGGVLMVESAIKWREGPRHYPLALTRAFVAALTIGIGFSHARLRRARALRIDDTGVSWRRRLIQAGAKWSEIKAVSIGDREAVFETINGSGPSLRLARLANRLKVEQAIEAAAREHGIPVKNNRLTS